MREEELLEEIRQLKKKISVIERQQRFERMEIERNRLNNKARENLNQIITAERSRLERYMRLFLANSPDVILLFNAQGELAFCGDTFLNITGIPVAALVIGRTYQDILSHFKIFDLAAELDKIYSASHADEDADASFETELEIDFALEGKRRDYIVRISSMRHNHKLEGAMVFMYDSTEFLAAKREAEQANAAKSDFLATVSHEIRTPLNAIMGITDMIRATSLDEVQESYLNKIDLSSKILAGLINDILDFSKMEVGKFEIVEDYFDFSMFLGNLQTVFELMFRQKGIGFTCEFDPNLPICLWADEKRLMQILSNILNNALKYTQKGGVTLRVNAPKENSLIFEIEDTGVGIKQEDFDRIFYAFEQLDLVKNKSMTGTGLGLSITRRLCHLMGGDIRVQSAYGEGTTFTMELPLTFALPQDLKNPEISNLNFTAPGARALVVDDVEINVEIAKFRLENYGVECDVALSGLEAIELCRQYDYHVIFMDQMMPEMDGIETVKQIRQQIPRAAQVPIVALTANAIIGNKELLLNSGFDEFLSKPINDDLLKQALIKFLPASLVIKTTSETS